MAALALTGRLAALRRAFLTGLQPRSGGGRPTTPGPARSVPLLAVVVPALVMPALAALAARGERRAAPQPPVITEPFRPVLACDHGTTLGQEGCGEREVLARDAQLNADVRVIFGLLGEGTPKMDFVRAQVAWLAYRHADCTSQSDAYLGGTEQPVAYVDCLASADAARRRDLVGFYGLLVQGMDRPPRLP